MKKKGMSLFCAAIFVLFSGGCAGRGFLARESKTEAIEVFEKARASSARGDYGESAVQFEQLLNDFPETPLVPASLYYLGEAYEGMNKMPEALAVYEKLKIENPDSFWGKAAETKIQRIKEGQE